MSHDKDGTNEFLHYLNSFHSNIKFTIEFTQDTAIPFLDRFLKLLQSALNDLRKLLLQNGYLQGIISYHINDLLNRNRHQPNIKPSVYSS